MGLQVHVFYIGLGGSIDGCGVYVIEVLYVYMDLVT